MTDNPSLVDVSGRRHFVENENSPAIRPLTWYKKPRNEVEPIQAESVKVIETVVETAVETVPVAVDQSTSPEQIYPFSLPRAATPTATDAPLRQIAARATDMSHAMHETLQQQLSQLNSLQEQMTKRHDSLLQQQANWTLTVQQQGDSLSQERTQLLHKLTSIDHLKAQWHTDMQALVKELDNMRQSVVDAKGMAKREQENWFQEWQQSVEVARRLQRDLMSKVLALEEKPIEPVQAQEMPTERTKSVKIAERPRKLTKKPEEKEKSKSFSKSIRSEKENIEKKIAAKPGIIPLPVSAFPSTISSFDFANVQYLIQNAQLERIATSQAFFYVPPCEEIDNDDESAHSKNVAKKMIETSIETVIKEALNKQEQLQSGIQNDLLTLMKGKVNVSSSPMEVPVMKKKVIKKSVSNENEKPKQDPDLAAPAKEPLKPAVKLKEPPKRSDKAPMKLNKLPEKKAPKPVPLKQHLPAVVEKRNTSTSPVKSFSFPSPYNVRIAGKPVYLARGAMRPLSMRYLDEMSPQKKPPTPRTLTPLPVAEEPAPKPKHRHVKLQTRAMDYDSLQKILVARATSVSPVALKQRDMASSPMVLSKLTHATQTKSVDTFSQQTMTFVPEEEPLLPLKSLLSTGTMTHLEQKSMQTMTANEQPHVVHTATLTMTPPQHTSIATNTKQLSMKDSTTETKLQLKRDQTIETEVPKTSSQWQQTLKYFDWMKDLDLNENEVTSLTQVQSSLVQTLPTTLALRPMAEWLTEWFLDQQLTLFLREMLQKKRAEMGNVAIQTDAEPEKEMKLEQKHEIPIQESKQERNPSPPTHSLPAASLAKQSFISPHFQQAQRLYSPSPAIHSTQPTEIKISSDKAEFVEEWLPAEKVTIHKESIPAASMAKEVFLSKPLLRLAESISQPTEVATQSEPLFSEKVTESPTTSSALSTAPSSGELHSHLLFSAGELLLGQDARELYETLLQTGRLIPRAPKLDVAMDEQGQLDFEADSTTLSALGALSSDDEMQESGYSLGEMREFASLPRSDSEIVIRQWKQTNARHITDENKTDLPSKPISIAESLSNSFSEGQISFDRLQLLDGFEQEPELASIKSSQKTPKNVSPKVGLVPSPSSHLLPLVPSPSTRLIPSPLEDTSDLLLRSDADETLYSVQSMVYYQ